MDKVYEKINKKKLGYDIIHTISTSIFIYTFFLIFYIAFKTEGKIVVLLFIPLVLTVLIASLMQYFTKLLSIEFKTKYVKMVFNQKIKNAKYEPKNGVSRTLIENAEIFPYFIDYSSDDLIKGNYHRIPFQSADIDLEEEVKTKNGSYNKSFFKGRIYQFAFNKNFKYNLVLVQKKDLFGDYRPGNLQTESVLFNSEFRVFSENTLEGFYLLTPHLMEKLLYLDGKYKDRIMVSFNRKKLYVITYGKSNPLEFKKFVKIDDSFIQAFIDEFSDIIDIINVLNLENDLFIKHV